MTPTTPTNPQTNNTLYHFCPDTLASACASALIHLSARLRHQSTVIVPYSFTTGDAGMYKAIADTDDIAFAPVRQITVLPGIPYSVRQRMHLYYDITDLVGMLSLQDHVAAKGFVDSESMTHITTQSLMLSRLYVIMGHDEFAAHIAYRLDAFPDTPYSIFDDDEALNILRQSDEDAMRKEML